MVEVFINSKLIGEVDDSSSFVSRLKEERRSGALHNNVNVYRESITVDVFIETDAGRTRRPLIVSKEGKPSITQQHYDRLNRGEMAWHDLIKEGIIEYVDAAEEENCLIAFRANELTSTHTHLEISPLTMLGLCSALVPYGNFNQSTRLNAGSKNQKQAVGIYASNYPVRLDMDVNILHSPQKPIVQTLMNDVWNYDSHPNGQNIVIAIMSYKGYNMEDAIVINRGSIDRGFGRSTYFRPSVAEELRYAGGLIDEISIPDKDVKGYKTEKD